MDQSDYTRRIEELSNPAIRAGWVKLSEELRLEAFHMRAFDPAMTFVEQGLAVQIDRFLSHLKRRKAELDRAKQILKDAEPIEDSSEEIEITVEEEIK